LELTLKLECDVIIKLIYALLVTRLNL